MARNAYLIASSEFAADSGLRRLLGPVNDVETLEKQLANPMRGEFVVSRFVNEEWGPIKKKLYVELKQKQPEDVVLIYFSGHGLIDEEDRKLYLSSVESHSENVAATSLLASELLDRLKYSPARQRVLILDCCYSGAVGDVGAKDGGPRRVNVESLQKDTGVTVLTASTEMQTAKDLDTERVGLFTKYLVEGLETGDADVDRNGVITAREMFDYASLKTRQVTNSRQEPKIIDVNTGHYHVSKSGRTRLSEIKKQLLEKLAPYLIKGEIDGGVYQFLLNRFGMADRLGADICAEVDSAIGRYLDDSVNYGSFIYEIGLLKDRYERPPPPPPPIQTPPELEKRKQPEPLTPPQAPPPVLPPTPTSEKVLFGIAVAEIFLLFGSGGSISMILGIPSATVSFANLGVSIYLFVAIIRAGRKGIPTGWMRTASLVMYLALTFLAPLVMYVLLGEF